MHDDLKLAWHHLAVGSRACGLRLAAWSISGAAALLFAIAIFLALEPTP